MQGTYTYKPDTNNVSRESSVAAVLKLQFVIHVMLFPKCKFAVPNMAVLCSSFISFCSGMMLRYSLNYFELFVLAPYYYWYLVLFISIKYLTFLL
jgi:hypothetical protein